MIFGKFDTFSNDLTHYARTRAESYVLMSRWFTNSTQTTAYDDNNNNKNKNPTLTIVNVSHYASLSLSLSSAYYFTLHIFNPPTQNTHIYRHTLSLSINLPSLLPRHLYSLSIQFPESSILRSLTLNPICLILKNTNNLSLAPTKTTRSFVPN